MTRFLLTPIPEGEIKSGLIANDQADDRLFEVFVHPFMAGELVACGKAGILKINGKPAWAEVVDRFGNGDYAVRIHIKDNDKDPAVFCYGYCGGLGWTVRHHSRVTHKALCPHRTEPWCQSHPKGCPDDCVPLIWQKWFDKNRVG